MYLIHVLLPKTSTLQYAPEYIFVSGAEHVQITCAQCVSKLFVESIHLKTTETGKAIKYTAKSKEIYYNRTYIFQKWETQVFRETAEITYYFL